MKFSQAVRPGQVVTKRGDKWIRPSRRSRGLMGVYVQAEQRVFLTDEGRETVSTPAGVQVSGPVTMSVGRA
jgi:hypothetical protein